MILETKFSFMETTTRPLGNLNYKLLKVLTYSKKKHKNRLQPMAASSTSRGGLVRQSLSSSLSSLPAPDWTGGWWSRIRCSSLPRSLREYGFGRHCVCFQQHPGLRDRPTPHLRSQSLTEGKRRAQQWTDWTGSCWLTGSPAPAPGRTEAFGGRSACTGSFAASRRRTPAPALEAPVHHCPSFFFFFWCTSSLACWSR